MSLFSREDENIASITEEIHLSGFILTKRGDCRPRLKQRLGLPLTIDVDQPPDDPRTVVAIEIDPIPLWHRAAIDIPARHRAAKIVAVFRSREQ